MKKTKILALLFPIIALILELLPNGVAMRFATPPGKQPFITHTSYFDLLPFGYANFAPLFTAVLTIVILIVLLVYATNGNQKLCKVVKIMSLVATIISLLPIFFSSYTVVGGFISISLFAEFLFMTFKKPADTDKE